MKTVWDSQHWQDQDKAGSVNHSKTCKSSTNKERERGREQKQMCLNSLKTEVKTKCVFVIVQFRQFCRNVFCLCAWWERRRKKKQPQAFFSTPQTAGCVLARTTWRPKLNTTSLQMRQRGGARRLWSTAHNQTPSLWLFVIASVSKESHLVSWQPCLSSQCSGSRGADLMTETTNWCTRVAEGGAQVNHTAGMTLHTRFRGLCIHEGLFFTSMLVSAHWKRLELGQIFHHTQQTDASQTDVLRTAKSPAGGLCAHWLKMHHHKDIRPSPPCSAAFYKLAVASCYCHS